MVWTSRQRRVLGKLRDVYATRAEYQRSLAEEDGPGTHSAAIERNELLVAAIDEAIREPTPESELDAKHVALLMEVMGLGSPEDVANLQERVASGRFD